jgi:hypothetical protein
MPKKVQSNEFYALIGVSMHKTRTEIVYDSLVCVKDRYYNMNTKRIHPYPMTVEFCCFRQPSTISNLPLGGSVFLPS